jgi:hypothetical protein
MINIYGLIRLTIELIESKATPIIQDKAHAVEKKLTSALMKYF